MTIAKVVAWRRGSCSKVTIMFAFLCGLLLMSLCVGDETDQTAIAGGPNDVSQEEQQQDCPIYRYFDTERPTRPQYGAPPGCFCVDGMSGIYCSFCDADDACQTEHTGIDGEGSDQYFCHKDVVFLEQETYKAYECRLRTLTDLIYNGKIALYVDKPNRSATMVLFNTRFISDYQFVECFLTDCDFPVGQSAGSCGNIGKHNFVFVCAKRSLMLCGKPTTSYSSSVSTVQHSTLILPNNISYVMFSTSFQTVLVLNTATCKRDN